MPPDDRNTRRRPPRWCHLPLTMPLETITVQCQIADKPLGMLEAARITVSPVRIAVIGSMSHAMNTLNCTARGSRLAAAVCGSAVQLSRVVRYGTNYRN